MIICFSMVVGSVCVGKGHNGYMIRQLTPSGSPWGTPQSASLEQKARINPLLRFARSSKA